MVRYCMFGEGMVQGGCRNKLTGLAQNRFVLGLGWALAQYGLAVVIYWQPLIYWQ